jgi:hypothetical protein
MVFICGKRGYGKSYTIGVFLEEIASLDSAIKQHLAVVVLDTLGIFWSTQFPSRDDLERIHRWKKPTGFPFASWSQATKLFEKIFLSKIFYLS